MANDQNEKTGSESFKSIIVPSMNWFHNQWQERRKEMKKHWDPLSTNPSKSRCQCFVCFCWFPQMSRHMLSNASTFNCISFRRPFANPLIPFHSNPKTNRTTYWFLSISLMKVHLIFDGQSAYAIDKMLELCVKWIERENIHKYTKNLSIPDNNVEQ